MGAAGGLYLVRGVLARWAREAWLPGVAIGLALLLAAGGALTVSARSRAYAHDPVEFPGAERAVALIAPRLAPGDKVLVLGMSQVPFLYYAHRQRLPYLTYVHDYVLDGWDPLRSARRVFVVVNRQALDRQGDTLARVLADAHLDSVPTPVELEPIEGVQVYLIARE
jgi:hypothetical protein